MGVAHVPLDLGLRGEGGYGIHDDDIHGSRSYERFRDIQRLLSVVGLGHPQFIHIDAEVLGVNGIEGVFRVYEGGDAPLLLGFGYGVERERGLSGGFGPIDLDDAPPRIPADSERFVDEDGSRRDDVDSGSVFERTEFHDGTETELLFDLQPRRLEGLHFFAGIGMCGFPAFLLLFAFPYHVSSEDKYARESSRRLKRQPVCATAADDIRSCARSPEAKGVRPVRRVRSRRRRTGASRQGR